MIERRKFPSMSQMRPRFNKKRSGKVDGKTIGYLIVTIIVFAFLWTLVINPIIQWIASETGIEKFEDDGIDSIGLFQVVTKDLLNEGASVTASAAFAQMPDGSIHSADTLAAGYAEWRLQIKEGMEIIIQADEGTNHYPIRKTFTVKDINAGTWEQTYYDLGTLQMWGMDASSDAGVVTVLSGTSLLFNGTAEEDQLAVTGGLSYDYSMNFNWDAADEEYFGVEEYTQISANKYTYIPVLRIITTDLCVIDSVTQDGVALELIFHKDDGTNAYFDYQIIPIREDEDIQGDHGSIFNFSFTPVLDSADTVTITFHDEVRKDRALIGILPAAVESVAALTTT